MTRPPSLPRPTQPAEGGAGQRRSSSPPTRTRRGVAYHAVALEAPAGSVAIVLTNESSVPHNVAIERDGSVVVEGESSRAAERAPPPPTSCRVRTRSSAPCPAIGKAVRRDPDIE